MFLKNNPILWPYWTIFFPEQFTKNHQWFHLRFNKFQHRDASTLVPFYGSYSKDRNKSKGCCGIGMNGIFQNWLSFYLYVLKTGWKKVKNNSKISKLLIFFGIPYVRHISKDLKTQILTILKINSEFLILKFSGITFVFEK